MIIQFCIYSLIFSQIFCYLFYFKSKCILENNNDGSLEFPFCNFSNFIINIDNNHVNKTVLKILDDSFILIDSKLLIKNAFLEIQGNSNYSNFKFFNDSFIEAENSIVIFQNMNLSFHNYFSKNYSFFLKNSTIIFEYFKIFHQNINFSVSFILLKVNNCILNIKNMILNDNIIQNVTSIFLVENSEFNISNSIFENNVFFYASFFSSNSITIIKENSFNNNKFLNCFNIFHFSYFIYIVNTNYSKIIIENSIFILIDQYSTVEIQNCNFNDIINQNKLIFIIMYSLNTIILNNILMKNIYNIEILIYIYYSNYFLIKNVNLSLITSEICYYFDETKEINFININFHFINGNIITSIYSLKRHFHNVTIMNSVSYNYTLGINIYDFTNNNQQTKIGIINCLFSSNIMLYSTEKYVGCILYIDSDSYLIINNSIFYNNSISKYCDITKILNHAPCLTSYSSNIIIQIFQSIFNENTSQFFSNCLYFQGQLLNITFSLFINNHPIYTNIKETIYLSVENQVRSLGGSILSAGSKLLIKNTIFKKNVAFNGGAIYFELDLKKSELIGMIENSIFEDNIAGFNGGTLDFTDSIIGLNYKIINSIFIKNMGKFGGVAVVQSLYENNSIVFDMNRIIENQAEYGGFIFIASKYCNINVINNYFANNYASNLTNRTTPVNSAIYSLFGVETTTLNSSGNYYFNSSSKIHGGITCLLGTTFHLNNEIINISSSVKMGGCFYVSTSKIYITNSILINCIGYYKGECIFSDGVSEIILKNVTIIRNMALYEANMFEVRFFVILTIINSTINNSNDLAGSLLILNNNLKDVSFINCTIYSSVKKITLFESYNSLLKFNNVSLHNIQTRIFISLSSTFTIIKLSLVNNSCVDKMIDPGCIFNLFDTRIQIENIFMNNITSYNVGLLLYAEKSEIFIFNASFYNLINYNSVGILVGSNIVIYLKNFNVRFCKGGSIIYFLESNLTLNNSNFSNKDIIQQNHPFIIVQNPIFFKVFQCIFEFNLAIKGGAIFMSSIFNSEIFFIIKSQFKNISVLTMGGSLYLYNCSIIIIDSIFVFNQAKEGGSIYFYVNLESSNKKLSLIDTIIQNNKAEIGGGIFWINKPPEINSDSQINNNTANIGKNFASIPTRIFINIYKKDKLDVELIFNSSNGNTEFQIENEAPGQVIKIIFEFIYADIYNQTMKSLNNIIETFDIISFEDYMNVINTNAYLKSNNILMTGVNSLLVNEGRLLYNNLLFLAPSNKTVYLKLVSNVITFYSSYIIYPHDFEYNISNKYTILIPIKLRECLIGELDLKTTCFPCPIGKFSLSTNDKACSLCIENAECMGLNIISLKSGYWRSSVNSSNIQDCLLYKNNCLGGIYSECNSNFYGPICGSCQKGFSKSGKNECIKCLEGVWMYVRIIGFVSVLLVVVFVLIRSSFKNNKILEMFTNVQKSKEIEKDVLKNLDAQSLYIKILMNFLQILNIVTVSKLDIPIYFSDFVSYISIITSFSNNLMAYECIFEIVEVKISFPFFRVLFANVLTVIIMILTSFFWIIRGFIRKKNYDIKNKIYSTIIGIYIMMLSNVLNENIKILNCIKIDNNYHLESDPVFSCDDDEYVQFSLFLNWPIFCLWSIFIPFFVLIFLFKNRRKLYDINIFTKFNFFYLGYKKNFYYWDFILIFRKCLFIIIVFLLKNRIKSTLVFLLLSMVISFYYQNKYKPFHAKNLNYLESLSNIIIIFIIFFNFFLVDSLEDFKGSSKTKNLFIYIILMIFMCMFLIFWGIIFFSYMTLQYYRQLKKRFPAIINKISTYIGSNTDVLKRMLSNRIKKDSKQYLTKIFIK